MDSVVQVKVQNAYIYANFYMILRVNKVGHKKISLLILFLILIISIPTSFANNKKQIQLKIEAEPHRVVDQHNVTLTAELTKGPGNIPLMGEAIHFFIKIDNEWNYIGSEMTDTKGIAQLEYFVGLSKGQYQIKAEFLGNENYDMVIDESSINVLRESHTIQFNPLTVRYSDHTDFRARMLNPGENPIPNRNITFQINEGNEWRNLGITIKTDKDGFAELPVEISTPPGNYDVKVIFKGGKFYGIGEEIFFNALTILKESTIIPTIIDFSFEYGDTEYLYASLNDDENIPIENEMLSFFLYWNGYWNEIGSSYTDSEGMVLIPFISNQDPGIYPLKVIHMESNNFLSSEKEGILTIHKENTMIYALEIKGNYGDLISFAGRLTDNDLIFNPLSGKPLSFNIEPSSTTWIKIGEENTDLAGWAYIPWTINIPPGGYNTKIEFNGDTYYNLYSQISSPGLIVERETILLANPSKSIYQGQLETIATKVTDKEYNPIQGIEVDFYISGSSWIYLGTVISNVNGIAAITVSINLATGTHTLKVSTSETAFYKSATTIGEIVIRPPLLTTDVTLIGGPFVSKYIASPGTPDSISIQASLYYQSTPLASKTINFYYLQGSNWVLLGSATTDNSGLATLTHSVIEAVGNYDLKVEFEGDPTYNGDTDVNTATSKEGYVVISEYAYAPWFERLSHSRHYNDAQAEAMGAPSSMMFGLLTKIKYYWYLCEWWSQFYFNWETYYYYKYYYWKDQFASGKPAPSDPCYIHEFRSYPPSVLEGALIDYLFIFMPMYATNLPGNTGFTDSDELEEWQDNVEEIEVYTKNPESLETNKWYDAIVMYKVETTESGNMVIEAELGDEGWWLAWLSPPGYPMKYKTLTDVTPFPAHTDHSSSSLVWIWDPPLNVSVNLIEYHPFRKVIINGLSPSFGEIDVNFEIDSFIEVINYINMQKADLNTLQKENPNEKLIVSISFKNLIPISEYKRIIENYNLTPILFRYQSEFNNSTFTGQTFPSETGWIIGNLTGIYRLDVLGAANNLYRLQEEYSNVLLIDLSYHQMKSIYKDKWFDNITINLEDFYFYYKKYMGSQNSSLSSIENPSSPNIVTQPIIVSIIVVTILLIYTAINIIVKRQKLIFGFNLTI